MGEFLTSRDQPLLFPQEFKRGDGTPEELRQHLELAAWTITALDKAKEQKPGREMESQVSDDYGAVSGTKTVLDRRLEEAQNN